MKITLSKTSLLTNKLHDELLEVITEKFSLTHNDENIFLNFKEINEIKIIVDEEAVVTYTKNIYTPTIIDKIEVIVKSVEFFDGNALKVTCNTCVNAHDNTPISIVDYDKELIDKIKASTTLEELISALTGEGGKAKVKAIK